MSETFKLKLVKQEPHKLKQVVGLFNVLDGAIYKGAYLTTAELLAVEAAEHDYADNFETNTRWTHTLYEWVDTGTQIPEDTRYVRLKDESVAATPNTVVIRDDNGEIHTAEPTNDDSAATKSYVDAEQTRAESAEQTLQESINAEIQRATTSENALAALIAEETTNRQTADNALTAQIEAETTRAKNAESALQATIEATGSQLDQLIIDETKRAQNAEGILADAIDEEIARAKAAEQMKIDKTLTSSIVESVEYTYDNATDASALSVKSINPSTNAETTTSVQLVKANETQSGLMSKENVTLLSQLNTRVASLEGRQYLYLYTASANPTADDINAFVLAQGGVSPFSGVEVLVEQTKHVWRYYENDNIGWRDDGIDTVQQATQTELGVVKGSATDGKVYVESDGTMSVMGYDALVESDSQNAQAIANETTARQDADTMLQTSIDAEKTRAQNAENALNVALSQEISDRQDADTAITEAVDAHIANTNNPHNVTKAQVGLGNVADERQYSEQNPPPYPVVPDGTYSGMTVGNATNAVNAQTATNAQQLGGVLADEYTLKTGTYPDMTVGNATNATNADTADSATSAQDAAKLGGVAASNYAQIDGSYSELGAGYLAKNVQIAASSSSIGWWKVGSIDLAVTGKASVSSSTVIRVTGLYSHVTPSGIIEINGRLQDGVLNPAACPLFTLSGNLNPSKFCVSFEEKTVSLYVKLESNYARYSFTIVQDDIEAKSNSDYFTFNPVYVGSSAPDGAVYAVRQIYASMSEKADKLSNTSAIGSTAQPVYINSEGIPTVCKDVPSKQGSYEFMNVGSANKLAVTQVGSSNQPVYFNSKGIPIACSGVATKANVNSASMVPYGGQATTLSALASGGVYNITANGFLRIAYQTTAADNYINMKQVDSEGADIWGALANGQKSYGSGYPFIYMPVAKGDHIKVDFSSSVKIIQVQLIKVKTV